MHAYNAAETRRPFMPVIKSEKLKKTLKDGVKGLTYCKMSKRWS